MAQQNLQGKKVAILVANDFEQVELTKPKEALEQAGAQTFIISPSEDMVINGMTAVHGAKGQVQGVNHDKPADMFKVDIPLEEAKSSDFDALLLPGGALNPDQLRIIDKAKQFVRDFDEAGKPIAVICHGPWTLVSAGLLKGRTITSWPTLADDIKNVGGNWVDQETVVDSNLLSSRGPKDIDAFNQKMIQLFAEGIKSKKEPAAAM
jgi:protease I